MKIMNVIGDKYEITMYQWYEKLAKAEKRLQESIECNIKFGDNEDWIEEDKARVENIEAQIEQVKQTLESNNVFIDYEKVQNMVKL